MLARPAAAGLALAIVLGAACAGDLDLDGLTFDSGLSSGESSVVQITSSTLPEARIGQLYQMSLQATGGEGPYSWSALGQPSWASVDAQGRIVGTPDESGLSNVTVEARDQRGKAGRRVLSLRVLYVILLTGFGPFAQHTVNPSWESIKPLEGERAGDYEVRTVQLPVEWDAAPKQLFARMDQDRPTVVVSAGVADSAPRMRLEKLAQNVALGTDNKGVTKLGVVVSGGPASYESGLPLGEMVAALSGKPLGADVSDNAGSYLCNYVFYQLMHRVQGRRIAAGFVHTPTTSASLPLAAITGAWRALLPALVTEHLGERPELPADVHTAPTYAGASE